MELTIVELLSILLIAIFIIPIGKKVIGFVWKLIMRENE